MRLYLNEENAVLQYYEAFILKIPVLDCSSNDHPKT
jgi:hypothetical protein